MQNTMDKNTIIGIVLMVLIMVGYSIWNAPSKEELAEKKRIADSTAMADSMKAKQLAEKEVKQDSIKEVKEVEELQLPDSVKDERLKNAYGSFAPSTQGEQEFYTLENDKLIMKISNKGGRVYAVYLKDYKTYDAYIADSAANLALFDGDQNAFDLTFSHANRNISTSDLYFQPTGASAVVTGEDSASLSMRLMAENGGYIEYLYKIHGDKYMVDFDINVVGLDGLVDKDQELKIDWHSRLPNQEKSLNHERQNSAVYYKVLGEDVENLGLSSANDEETADQKIRWVAFKQKFFSSVLIAEDGFNSGANFKQFYKDEETDYVKDMSAGISLPGGADNYNMSFYFGPNHYRTLRKYKHLELDGLVYLGWAIFGWINRFAVIPVFNLLDGFHLNYGIVILILTILLKMVLFPIAYRSYMSSAKMRVLKPEINELNEKYKDKEAMEKQQATMALYRKAGVNPLAGCIPAVLQMPILFAMFNFFPNSIELRQQAFLWAEDLSTYDSIFNFPGGFEIPFYGDHVSLFTLMMTISTVIYTRMNSSLMGTPGGSDAMAKQMKIMMYVMPIMFLGVLNSYPCGLSYYYLLANLITFGQQFAFTKAINEDAIRAKIEENKKKPKKESAFQKRLEEMAKQQGVSVPRKERRKDKK